LRALGKLAAVSVLLWGACHGGRGAQETAIPLCASRDPGPAPLRRLTRFEYGRTLQDLLGADPALAGDLPPDEETLGFDDSADAYSVSGLHATSYLEVAEQAAAAYTADAARLAALAGCDPTGGDDACVGRFIAAFGAQAWRRPLDDGERASMQQLYADTADPAPADGLSAVVAAMLQAPQFLYRPEAPVSGTAPEPLDGFALATRLSYLVLGAPPDAPLLAAAAAGRLDGEQGLLAETDRLLGDPRAADLFVHFATEWWELEELPGLEKDRTLYRLWTDGTPAALGEETRQFLVHAWQDGPTLGGLLTSPVTFADTSLASFYGLPTAAGDGYQRIDLDPARAAGMLTQGSFLAVHAKPNQTSPVLRGKFVRARLFCAPPPPPPPDVVIRPPAVDPRLSTRERYAQHTADPLCASCHAYMDPVGFAFENYDAAGRWRDVDGGQPVDASGMLTATDVDGPLEGVPDLAARLASSAEVRSCAATQWFRYAFGRSEQTAGDGCTIDALAGALTSSGGDWKAMVRATVRMPAFRNRPPEAQP
jgi:hypothetical protein